MTNPEILDLTYYQGQILAYTYVPHPTIPVTVASGLYLPAGTIIGIITSSGLAAAYATGNEDGTQNPVGVLAWTVNSSSTTQGGYFPQNKNVQADIYMGGAFYKSILVANGLDSGAITAFGGVTWPNGVFKFG